MCLVPSVSYTQACYMGSHIAAALVAPPLLVQKFAFIVMMPAVLGFFFVVMHLAFVFYKACIKGRRRNLHRNAAVRRRLLEERETLRSLATVPAPLPPRCCCCCCCRASRRPSSSSSTSSTSTSPIRSSASSTASRRTRPTASCTSR